MEALRRLLRLLTSEERSRLLGVLLTAIAAGLLETLAVLSVMPFMAMVSDPARFIRHPVAEWARESLGLAGTRDFLLATGAGVLVLVVLSNVAGTLSLRRIHLTAWNINHYLSLRILGAYLSRPYTWFLDRHSSSMNRNLLEEVRLVVQGALLPLLYAGSRGVTALLLVVLLLFVDVRLTLVAGGVLGVAYLVIYFSVRRLQEWLGEMRKKAARTRFRVAAEALGGIKEVRSLGAERKFLKEFETTGPPFVRATAWNLVIAEIPRHLLEVLSVGTVLVILLFLLLSGSSLEDALPVLTVFAFAGYKLVPAFHQVFTGATTARFYLSSLEELQEDLAGPVEEEASSAAGGPPLVLTGSLELDGVTFRYPGADGSALEEVSLELRRGDRIGIVGPTGSGKTTLVDVLMGLLRPQEGEMRVDGKALRGEDWARWRASVGYVPQHIFLSDSSLKSNVAFGLAPEDVDRERVREVIRMAELEDFVRELPRGLETTVGERGVRLSGGQRQRIAVARALYRDPSLLLLDEATSALDGATEEAVMDAVFGLGRERTLVVVAHRLSTVRRCDRIVVLQNGRVAARGEWDELLDRSDLFRLLARLDGSV
jgi:ATP-binding cassette subfamily C protein